MSRFEAAVAAARTRLRPILMTSFAFIFGVFPLVIASGSGKLVSGTVLAKVGAKYVPAAASGSDGSQTAVAVLLFPVDATSADAKAVIVSRHAIASHAGLTYGATINDATKRAAANAQLGAVGIIVRQGA